MVINAADKGTKIHYSVQYPLISYGTTYTASASKLLNTSYCRSLPPLNLSFARSLI